MASPLKKLDCFVAELVIGRRFAPTRWLLAMTISKTGVATMTAPLAAKIAREYGTPVAVIDMDRVERNIARIQKACEAAGVANRPHIKTHKSPMLAKLQIEAGAHGITCQKL